MNKLYFGKGNAKLAKKIYTFGLPSGYTCPGALDCLSRANRFTGKIKDGPSCQFRCYSASEESRLPNVRNCRWTNFSLLRDALKKELGEILIINSLPYKANIIRIGVSGDFFSEEYMQCWVNVANQFQSKLFYAYTKSIPYWLSILNKQGWPPNFVLTASWGGKYDYLIEPFKLKNARVVFSQKEADNQNLLIDHTDEFAMKYNPRSFGLLLHGIQKSNSLASKAHQELIKLGFKGYSK